MKKLWKLWKELTKKLKKPVESTRQVIWLPIEGWYSATLAGYGAKRTIGLIKNLGVNWLAADGIWFQEVEFKYGWQGVP